MKVYVMKDEEGILRPETEIKQFHEEYDIMKYYEVPKNLAKKGCKMVLCELKEVE
jgi:hypothetical protein